MFPHADKVLRLTTLGAVGETTATVLVAEIYHRTFLTRRQVASFVGLAPSPYKSGEVDRDRGINKAGSKLARHMLVELAWFWLRYQSNSQLSQWWHARFGNQGMRGRKVGIVALARKLAIAPGALSKTVSCQKEPHSRFDARADSYRKSVSLSRQRRGGWRPRGLLALCSPAVEWSAICVLRPSAIVNTDYGKRVFALSPDTRRCAGALGHGRMNRDRRLQVGCEKRKRGLAMK